MSQRTIWLLSAYHSGSHAAWSHWLRSTFTQYNWHLISLPGRHFRWRIRGNPLSWLNQFPDQTPDLLVATSMVDLATLRGLHPRLVHVPSLYYFHENQFAYPESGQQHASIDPQMVQLYGALAADRLAFNSAFNQQSFLAGVAQLLQQFPDQVPADITDQLKRKCVIAPVPIHSLPALKKQRNMVLWNHRWEYDKAPEQFAHAMSLLKQAGINFQLALLGPRSNNTHPALARLRCELGEHILIDEHTDAAGYRHWLGRAQIVVSTAIHEFQGLSLLEAASAGAIPLVPDHLCYPEIYPACYRYPPGDVEKLTDKLQQLIEQPLPEPFDTTPWHVDRLKPQWQTLLD